jgi:hypothetical protein
MSQTAAGDVTSDFDELEQSPPRSKLRLRFSLLALLAFVTVACLVLAWLVQPNMVVATALFKVTMVEPTLLGDESIDRFNEREFELVKNTQLTKLSSYYVLNKALRKPGIAALPILASKRDPVAWLQEQLEADFPGDGELLAIRLRGPESFSADLVQIVDAVSDAYQEEVIFGQKSRMLNDRELQSQALRELTKEAQAQMQLLNDMAAELGEEAKNSSELKMRQQEVDVLTEQIRELRRHLERDKLESRSPSGITKVQPAVAAPE